MKVRFQADADLNHIIVLAALRREPAVDFQGAVAARLESLDDASVLSLAAREGRVPVTHDHRTMPTNFAERIVTEPSAGFIVVRTISSGMRFVSTWRIGLRAESRSTKRSLRIASASRFEWPAALHLRAVLD